MRSPHTMLPRVVLMHVCGGGSFASDASASIAIPMNTPRAATGIMHMMVAVIRKRIGAGCLAHQRSSGVRRWLYTVCLLLTCLDEPINVEPSIVLT